MLNSKRYYLIFLTEFANFVESNVLGIYLFCLFGKRK